MGEIERVLVPDMEYHTRTGRRDKSRYPRELSRQLGFMRLF